MRTDQLIAALAADAPTGRETGFRSAWLRAAGLGFALSVLAFFLSIGARPDVGSAIGVTGMKILVTGLAAAAGLWAYDRLARPETSAASAAAPAALAAVALAIWIMTDLVRLGLDGWTTRLMGHNASHCLTLVPLFAMAPLAALAWRLRAAAPTRPTLAGAAAGLAAAGLGASLYALNCDDDSALFVATWYPLATLIVCALGAMFGRFTRW